jgi:hypothetical protein
MLKHHYSAFFISSHLRHFLTVSVAETPATLHFPPVAETPITSNLSSSLPMLKHHYSAFFSFPSAPSFFSPPSSTKQLRPAIVSPLSVAETPFISNPSFFSPPSSTKKFRPAIAFTLFCC